MNLFDFMYLFRGIVKSFILLNQLGFCIIYTIFVAQNLKAVFDDWYCIHVRLYILMLLLPLIGLACIRNLKLLAPFSTTAIIAILIGEKNFDYIDSFYLNINFQTFFCFGF